MNQLVIDSNKDTDGITVPLKLLVIFVIVADPQEATISGEILLYTFLHKTSTGLEVRKKNTAHNSKAQEES
jgi:hypothetical protein